MTRMSDSHQPSATSRDKAQKERENIGEGRGGGGKG